MLETSSQHFSSSAMYGDASKHIQCIFSFVFNWFIYLIFPTQNQAVMRFPFSSCKLFSDFVLTEHASFGNPNSTGLIGLDPSGNIVIYDYDTVRQKERGKTTIKMESSGKVVNIITQNFLKSGPSHLVTIKDGDSKFTNVIYSRDGTKIDLASSSAAPFVVTDPKSLQPLVVLGDGSSIKFFSFKDGKPIEKPEYRLDGALSGQHTSLFLDLSGDMRPNLALHMVSNGNNYLAIHDFHTDSKKQIQRLPLPKKIGPLLYFDTNGNNAYDLIYLSIENGNSFLNIHKNQSVPDFDKVDLARPEDYFDKVDPAVIYNDEPDFKFNLLKLIDGTAVLRDEDGMPTGMFLTDIRADGGRSIIVTMREGDKTRLRCLEYENDELKISEYNSSLEDYKNVLSVSALDIYDRGKNDLLINCVVDGKPLVIVEKVPSPDVNSKLSALACLSNINHSLAHLPGVTYLVHYDNGTKWRKMSQMTATSYKSLQQKSAFIGLGQTNFFLNFVMARTNSAERNYDHYIVRGIIVPNTSVVFLVTRDEWIKQNFFLLNRYYIVAISLVGLLIFNLAILFYLMMKEKSTVPKTNVKGRRLGPVFAAL